MFDMIFSFFPEKHFFHPKLHQHRRDSPDFANFAALEAESI